MMNFRKTLLSILILPVFFTWFTQYCGGDEDMSSELIKLPEPKMMGEMSLEECLANRRSVRKYADEQLTLEQISQILWAAQGITSEGGGRTAPSAGAKYPLEIYAVVSGVEGLAEGLYRYKPVEHALLAIRKGDLRKALCASALGQKCVLDAPITIVIAADYERTRKKYGERTERYVHMEVGYSSQNIYLQAESLGLGTVAVGAFEDGKVKDILNEKYEPLLLMPVGIKSITTK